MKVSGAQQILQLLTQYARNITVGDTITGRILSVENGLLLLQLLDGSHLSAQIQSEDKYSAGDVLKLEVMDKKDGQVFVRELEHTVVRSAPKNPTEVLKSLNLPADSKRMEVVEALLDMGIKPDAEMVEKSVLLLKDKQVIDVKQAVFLTLNRMEEKDAYFPLLKKTMDKTFHFAERWQNFVGQLKELDEKTLMRIAKELQVYETVQKTDLSVFTGKMIKTVQSDNFQGLAPERYITESLVGDILVESMNMMGETSAGVFNEAVLSGKIGRFFPAFHQLTQLQQESILRMFQDILTELSISIREDEMTMQETERIVDRSLLELPPRISIESSEASLPKVKEWLEDIERKMAIVHKNVIDADDPDSERFLPVLHEMGTAVEFFRDIQSYGAYVQIPLVLKENATRGELYVMKRNGKRSKIDSDDFSLFLSLTTQNLGMMDMFIHVKDKNVMLQVMVEDEKFYELLNEEYKPLYQALKQKGYQLYSMKHMLRDEGLTLLNADRKASELLRQDRKIDYRI